MVSAEIKTYCEQSEMSELCCSPHERFRCKLTKRIMKDPVTTPFGYNFERNSILNWLKMNGNICPVSSKPLKPSQLSPNTALQWEILYWQRSNGDSALDVSRHKSSLLLDEPARKVDAPPCAVPRSPDISSSRKMTDSPPSVPRRKNSDIDLTETSRLAFEFEKSKFSGETSLCRSLMVSDILRTLSMTEAPKIPERREPLNPEDILSVLDDVEEALMIDDF